MIKETSETGMGLCSVLFIVFLVLKLVGVITWSWWWVTAPLWLPVALIVVLLVFYCIIAGIIALL